MWATCWNPEGDEIMDLSIPPLTPFFFLPEDDASFVLEAEDDGLAVMKRGQEFSCRDPAVGDQRKPFLLTVLCSRVHLLVKFRRFALLCE